MFGAADTDLQNRLTLALGAVMTLRGQLAADSQLSNRWRAVKQFQADRLRAWLDDRPISAVPLSRVDRAWLWLRRNRALAAASRAAEAATSSS